MCLYLREVPYHNPLPWYDHEKIIRQSQNVCPRKIVNQYFQKFQGYQTKESLRNCEVTDKKNLERTAHNVVYMWPNP